MLKLSKSDLVCTLSLPCALAVSSFAILSMLLLAGGLVGLTAKAIHRRQSSGRVWLVLVAIGYWAACAFAVGSLQFDVGDLAQAAGSDGRVLIPYWVLAVFASLRKTLDTERLLSAISVFLLVQSSMLFWLSIISRDLVIGGDGLMHGFASSHHVPGFMAACGLVMVLFHGGWQRRTRVLLAVPHLGVAFMADSRASYIGLALAIATPFCVSQVRRAGAKLAVVAVLGLVLLAIPFSRAALVRSADRAGLVAAAATFSDELSGRSTSGSQLDGRTVNVARRFKLFGEGFDRFAGSPIVGTGPLTFDDEIEPTSVAPMVSLSYVEEPRHNDRQAHNLVLHLLAEGGLIGAMVMLGPWVAFSSIGKVGTRERQLSSSMWLLAMGAGVATLGPLTPGLGMVVGMVLGLGGTGRMVELPDPVLSDSGSTDPVLAKPALAKSALATSMTAEPLPVSHVFSRSGSARSGSSTAAVTGSVFSEPAASNSRGPGSVGSDSEFSESVSSESVSSESVWSVSGVRGSGFDTRRPRSRGLSAFLAGSSRAR